MTKLPKIQTFLEEVGENREYTGDVSEQFFDGEVEIRMSIGEIGGDDHRSGSFSILLQWDGDIEELAHKRILRVADLDDKYEDLEDKFVDLIDEHLGHNAYEPQIDEADRPGETEYNIVFHDSVVVFD